MKLNPLEKAALSLLALLGLWCGCGGMPAKDPAVSTRSVIFLLTQDMQTEVTWLHAQMDHCAKDLAGELHCDFRRTFVGPDEHAFAADLIGTPDGAGCYALEIVQWGISVPRACFAGPDDLRGAATSPLFVDAMRSPVAVTFVATTVGACCGKSLNSPSNGP